MEANEIATRSVGVELIFASIIGLYFNISSFRRFLSSDVSSFNILCTSKTISNSMSLLIYLFYLGPTQLLYTTIGSVVVSSYVNQTLGFGLLTQSPVTQTLITINRFLVVWFTPTGSPKYSNRITVGVLIVTWILAIYFSTLIGFPDDCLNPFSFDSPGSTQTMCNWRISWYMVYALFFMTVFNNLMNLLIAGKLVWSLKFQKYIKSEMSRKRRQSTIRFFLQSCLQDWLFVLDVANNLLAVVVCHNKHCIILWTMSFDVLIYGFDGLIMYLFNKKRRERKSTIVTSMVNKGNTVSPIS